MRRFLLAIFFFPFIIHSQTIDYQLLIATYNNNDKAVFDLLRQGANPNYQTAQGTTPLMYAVQNGNIWATKKLLDAGANPDINTYSSPAAIFNAVINNDTALTYILLDYGNADPNVVDKQTGKTPVFYSIDSNNYIITDLLLYYGAKPDTEIYSVTPLLEAIDAQADTSIIRLLVEYGANPNHISNIGYTPLILATEEENIAAADKLLQLGANPTVAGENLKTPLFYAIKNGNNELIDLYIPYFDKNQLDKYYPIAANQNFSYAQKKIKQATGKKYLSPILGGIIIGLPILFSYNDFFTGAKFGIAETHYNFDVKIGVLTRFGPKAVRIEQNPNYFLQLREKRTVFISEIDKKFTLIHKNNSSKGIFVRGTYNFSAGSYKGTDMPLMYKSTASPTAGFWYQSNIFGIKFGYTYNFFHPQMPHYFSLDFYLIIR